MLNFKGVIMNYRRTEYCLDVTYDNSKDRIEVKSIDRVYKGHSEVYDDKLIAEMNSDKAFLRRISRYLDGFFEGDEDFMED